MTRKDPTPGSDASGGTRPQESWIVERCGEEAFRIFDALSIVEADGKTDYDLASALDLGVNHVRRGLYLLEENRLVKRREYGRGESSSPSGYTYHANWPLTPHTTPEKEKSRKTDVPECYRWEG